MTDPFIAAVVQAAPVVFDTARTLEKLRDLTSDAAATGAKLAVSIGGIRLTEKGARRPDYDEAPVTAHMKGREIEIGVDLGVGRGKARIWTCDLTHGYIAINGDYRS